MIKLYLSKEYGCKKMLKQKFVYYQEDDMYVGYLEEFPDYMTQGETLEELKLNLVDIYKEIVSVQIPFIHHIAELEIA